MNNSTYLAVEIMAALITLILMYANNVGIKEHTRKRELFNVLLIINEIEIVSDAITYLPFDWSRMEILLNVLLILVYTMPSLMKYVFSSYLYTHISEKTPISKRPFIFMQTYCGIECIVIFLLCITKKMYYVENGVFYSGPAEVVYLLTSVFSMLVFVALVVRHARQMGSRDTIAVLPFSIIPLLSMGILVVTGLNVLVAVLALVNMILYVTIQSENESNLFKRANVDELTGLYNRAAYHTELAGLSKSEKDSLVYASVDLNGLKVANDTLGHAAGDELICGAADCLKQAFAGAGKVFRIGGDEFAVVFFVDENNYKFEIINGALDALTKRWKGRHVDTLTLSVGYASKKEFPDESVIGLAKIADKRMYAEKSKFYAQKGKDRRGQNNAYRALSSLYTKILKINITEDNYTIVDMFSDEQTQEKGFAERISEWLIGFGKSGLVHPDDLEQYLSKTSLEYMRNHFKSGKTYLMVSYRRKYDDEFKPAIMEIIPTNEYTDDAQSLYLYVKRVG